MAEQYDLYEHEKQYLFPREFNELRDKIYTEFPTLWKIVGGMMAHDHESFLEYMNAACDTNITAHTHSMEDSCVIWMKKLDLIRRSASSGIILPSGSDLNI